MNFWSKRIKNNKSIADALEVNEKKIKALKEDKLEIKGGTLDKTLKAIEDEKINKAIRDNEIWRWVQDTDFKAKRKEFGYKSQVEVARLIGCDVSIICRLETQKERFKKVSPKLIDIYNFYTNDFNKKVKEEKVVKSAKIYTTNMTRENANKDNKSIWKWYKNTDIRALRKSKNLTCNDLAKKINISASCISDLELKKCKRLNKTMIKVYNYLNNNVEEVKDETLEDKIYTWYKSIEDLREYRRNFGYSLNKFMSALNLSYDQARTFERHEYKKATPIVIKIYEFYQDENNRLPKIEWEPNENNTFVEKRDEQLSTNEVADAFEVTKNDEILLLENRIKHQELKIQELELQLRRYEKLIDRL